MNQDPMRPIKKKEVALVGLQTASLTKMACDQQLKELSALCHTFGLLPTVTFQQQRLVPHRKSWVGKGKLEEISAFIKKEGLFGVVFDHELSPAHFKNLRKSLSCKIWDRSLLILEIFAKNARTKEAKIQVALAQAQYLLPRLTHMWTHLSRQRGGRVMMRGVGEKELETDKRLIQKKIVHLKKELKEVAKQNLVQRKRRKYKINISLVGYTNAGKSTLMRALSKSEVKVAHQLFSTLSTTVRQIQNQEVSFLLADTVGFIRKLPPSLLKAFRTTLQEVVKADLLLHVVDIADEDYTNHIAIVNQTLDQIGASNIPQILILNKYDLLKKQEGKLAAQERIEALMRKREKVTLPMVALSKKHLVHLQKKIVSKVKQLSLRNLSGKEA